MGRQIWSFWTFDISSRGKTYFVWSAGCIHALAPNGSSFSDVMGPRGWFRSPPDGGRPNIKLLLRGPDEGYNFRPHSSSSVGHGEAELKQPGTGSSERSFRPEINLFANKNFCHTFGRYFAYHFDVSCKLSPHSLKMSVILKYCNEFSFCVCNQITTRHFSQRRICI